MGDGVEEGAGDVGGVHGRIFLALQAINAFAQAVRNERGLVGRSSADGDGMTAQGQAVRVGSPEEVEKAVPRSRE